MLTGKAQSTAGGFALIAAASLLVSGCGGYLLQSRDMYDMYRAPQTAQAQILNPEAGKNQRVVAGLDGPAAEQVNASYVQSFERTAETKAAQTFAGLAGISSN
jgi:hypothetical protein